MSTFPKFGTLKWWDFFRNDSARNLDLPPTPQAGRTTTRGSTGATVKGLSQSVAVSGPMNHRPSVGLEKRSPRSISAAVSLKKSYPKPLFQIIYVLHPMKMTYRSVIASSTLPRGIFFQTVGFEDLLAMSRCQGSDWRIEISFKSQSLAFWCWAVGFRKTFSRKGFRCWGGVPNWPCHVVQVRKF